MLKLRVRQVNMSQRYNDSIKRQKLQDSQLGILKIYAFCRKIQQRAFCPGESAIGVTYYVFENTPKNLMVQGKVQLEHNSHIIKVVVKATCLHFNP